MRGKRQNGDVERRSVIAARPDYLQIAKRQWWHETFKTASSFHYKGEENTVYSLRKNP